MKKYFGLIVIIGLILLSSSIPNTFKGFVGLEMLSADTVIANNELYLFGNRFTATTQTNPDDTVLVTEAYLEAGGSDGVSVLSYDKNTGIASISTSEMLIDTTLIENVLEIRNDSIFIRNGNGASLNELSAYLKKSDSTEYITPYALSEYATHNYVDSATIGATKNTYRIELPTGSDAVDRADTPVESPSGWTYGPGVNDNHLKITQIGRAHV